MLDPTAEARSMLHKGLFHCPHCKSAVESGSSITGNGP